MKRSGKNLFITAVVLSLLLIPACKQLQQFTGAAANLKKLQFKLKDVDNFNLSGINLSSKNSVKDFSVSDGLNLYKAFNGKKFPAEFILNVEALNPNDGSGGSQQTAATLTSFDWRLYIDDVPTISGNIAKPIEIPGTGQTTIIPLSISLDLYQFFSEQGYDKILNLALAIGGVNGSAARLKLDAQPTVTTPLGKITYPGRLTIIDKQFN